MKRYYIEENLENFRGTYKVISYYCLYGIKESSYQIIKNKYSLKNSKFGLRRKEFYFYCLNTDVIGKYISKGCFDSYSKKFLKFGLSIEDYEIIKIDDTKGYKQINGNGFELINSKDLKIEKDFSVIEIFFKIFKSLGTFNLVKLFI